MFKIHLIISLLCLAMNAFAHEGGGMVGGGGGTGVILPSGQLTLLDYYPLKDKLTTSKHKPHILKPYTKNKTTLELPLFNAQGVHIKSVKTFINYDNARFKDAIKLAEDLMKSAPGDYAKKSFLKYPFVGSVLNAYFYDIGWIFTDQAPENQFRFQLSDPSLRTETLAYYYKTQYDDGFVAAAVLSVPRWNRLDFISQAGLIVHELLRHFQISLPNYSPTTSYSEDDLQKATALIMLCEYDRVIEDYLTLVLSGISTNFKITAISFDEAKNNCRAISN